jgi:hypothetical protein
MECKGDYLQFLCEATVVVVVVAWQTAKRKEKRQKGNSSVSLGYKILVWRSLKGTTKVHYVV